jgi:hypothetical protein
VKILRLGNSDDLNPAVPVEDQGWYYSQSLISAAIGEPVETVVRPIWPGLELPGLVDEWLDRYEPDLVFLKVTWYWYAYESVPRRIERIFGRAGKPVANAGLAAAKKPALARNAGFKAGRRLAHRLIGGDTPFSPKQVITVMEETIRRVTAREDIALLVKGTGDGRGPEDGIPGSHARYTKRRIEVEGTLQRFCESVHVPYIGTGRIPSVAGRMDLEKTDGLHRKAASHNRMGLWEGEAMLKAWLDFRGEDGARARPRTADLSQGWR